MTSRKLAIAGGTPAFNTPLHVGRPNMGDKDELFRRINGLIERRWFTNDGPLVREFEQRISNYLGVKHCVVMCNATIALEIAIRALELRGEVIVPSYTFIATAHALTWQQITPVFADIDPTTHNLDPRSVQALVTENTSAIIGVHLWGRACDIEALNTIAKKHDLKLLFDAAHAFACSKGGQLIGTFGDCEVFSFHATKFLNSFEGGAVVTNSDDLAAKMRLMRNFGFAGYDNVVYAGTNGKLTEVCAAMGLTSLDNIDEQLAVNSRNYAIYQKELADVPGLVVLQYDLSERNNFQYVVVEVTRDAKLTRDEIVSVLHRENVLARKYFWPGCHLMEPYRSTHSEAAHHLPNTDCVAARVIVLPTGTAVGIVEIKTVCEIIRRAMAAAAEIRGVLNHPV